MSLLFPNVPNPSILWVHRMAPSGTTAPSPHAGVVHGQYARAVRPTREDREGRVTEGVADSSITPVTGGHVDGGARKNRTSGLSIVSAVEARS